jgi:hypothetical protein
MPKLLGKVFKLPKVSPVDSMYYVDVMASSKLPAIAPSLPAPAFSTGPERKHRCFSVCRQSGPSLDLLIPLAMCMDGQ